MYNYIYQPGFMDVCDPIVIRGKAIQPGTRVRISRNQRPPMFPAYFVVIVDERGNVQHCFKSALVRRIPCKSQSE